MGLKAQGLKAYEAFNDDGQPLCIIPRDYRDEGLGVIIWTLGGEIVGVQVYDAQEDYRTVAAVGEIPESHRDPRRDALTGEDIEEAGWTVTAPMDGRSWDFTRLTGILTALAEGTFGIKVRTPADEELLAAQYEQAWSAGYNEALEDNNLRRDDTANPNLDTRGDSCCPQEECYSCPDPDTCDNLRRGEVRDSLQATWKVNAREEPLGWDAPELGGFKRDDDLCWSR